MKRVMSGTPNPHHFGVTSGLDQKHLLHMIKTALRRAGHSSENVPFAFDAPFTFDADFFYISCHPYCHPLCKHVHSLGELKIRVATQIIT